MMLKLSLGDRVAVVRDRALAALTTIPFPMLTSKANPTLVSLQAIPRSRGPLFDTSIA